MADQKLTALTATTTPILTDIAYLVVDPGGSPLSRKVTLSDLQAILSIKDVCDGRLTLESGVPVSTSDQANKTTLYYTFYKGNKIGLYDGTSWHVRTFAELSLAVGAYTASKPYDIWVYDNAGTPALDSTVWTNATTRATALAYQDGVLVKSGAATRRYVGTIYIDSGQKCQDKLIQRFVWNFYNREQRMLYVKEDTAHTYLTAAWRAWNNDAALAQFELVCGLGFNLPISQNFNGTSENGKVGYINIGLDSTSSGWVFSVNPTIGNYGLTGITFGFGVSGYAGLSAGYHYLCAIEDGSASASVNFQKTENTAFVMG